MQEARKFFPGAVFLYAFAAAYITAIRFFSQTDTPGTLLSDLNSWVLPAVVFGSYVFNWLFLRKPRGIPLLVAINALLFGLSLAAVILTGRFGSWLAWVFTIGGMLHLQVCSYLFCLRAPDARNYLPLFEGITVMMLFFLFYCNYHGVDRSFGLPILTASMLSLSLVVYRRVAGAARVASGVKFRGIGVITMALLIVVLALMFFLTYFAGPLSQGLVNAYAGIKWLLRACGDLMMKVLAWFFSLFPEYTPEASEYEGLEIPANDSLVNSSAVQLDGTVLLVLGVLLGLSVIAGFCVFAWRNRRQKRGGVPVKVAARSRILVSRPSLRSALKAAWSRLWQKLSWAWKRLLYRDRPGGLFLFLQWRCRHSAFRRQAGETTRSFLWRLSQTMEAEELDAAEQLRALSAELDRSCFAVQAVRKQKKLAWAGALRHSVRRLLRKEAVKRSLSRLRRKEA